MTGLEAPVVAAIIGGTATVASAGIAYAGAQKAKKAAKEAASNIPTPTQIGKPKDKVFEDQSALNEKMRNRKRALAAATQKPITSLTDATSKSLSAGKTLLGN